MSLPRRAGARNLPLATLVALGVMSGVILLFACGLETVGFISFSQPVAVNSSRQINRVWFANYHVAEEMRHRVELTVDRRLFHWEATDRTGSNTFMATVSGGDRVGLFRNEEYIIPHLVLLIEYSDGSAEMRVVDVPPGHGRTTTIVVEAW